MFKKYASASAVVILLYLISLPLFANNSAAAIDAPDKAAKGSVITIKVAVTHHGNNSMHHTEWVYVKVNGKEIARWDFNSKQLPESENFTRTVTYKVDGPATIEAEASCNLHGSNGKALKKVEVQ